MVHDALSTLERVSTERDEGRVAARLLQQAAALVDGELGQVRSLVAEIVDKGPGSAQLAADHLIGGGGKAVRPILTLVAARAAGGDPEAAIPFAAAAELVHNATLLHDDVIDDGTVRRGRPTPRLVWGNTVAVLAGDLLFVQAMRMVERQGNPAALDELLQTVTMLVEGEVLQFDLRGSLDISPNAYDQIVERKTASLFRWCARAGARAGNGDDRAIEALGRFGRHLGMAFQLGDDMLDLTARHDRLGKDLAADLSGGKVTLPVLYALERVDGLAEILSRRPLDDDAIERAVIAVRESGGIEMARQRLDRELELGLEAIAELPRGPARDVLHAVARAVALRDR